MAKSNLESLLSPNTKLKVYLMLDVKLGLTDNDATCISAVCDSLVLGLNDIRELPTYPSEAIDTLMGIISAQNITTLSMYLGRNSLRGTWVLKEDSISLYVFDSMAYSVNNLVLPVYSLVN